ncbi:type IX secretion system motor protein PorM/GldM [Croceiramulus getboli]|nr:gliding motility protein GldM [Flavobacteriaceae bacterium YJPT1-3]
MAGGKTSARQKMINLMYLVFIAMIAMTVDTEVLNAFGIFDKKFQASNERLEDGNEISLEGLEQKAVEQSEKYTPLLEQAKQVKEVSDELFNYIGEVRATVTADVDQSRYAQMNRSDVLDEYWFTGDRPTKEGQEFLSKIEEYKTKMAAILGDSELNQSVQSNFDLSPVKTNEGATQDWLNYNFEGYPMAASITRFTQMQNDIRAAQSAVFSGLLQGQLESEVSLSNYQAIVVPEKTAFFNGENFKGKVVLGRFDSSLTFDEVVINGKKVDKLEAGQVVLDFPAGSVGEKEILGELKYTEGEEQKSIPIKSSYAVIPKPNSAVISADKMNVVYRGVDNPMTISIPGVGNVSANAPGLKATGGAGNYLMNVTSVKGREVTIKVSGKLPGGETVSDNKTFRIKDIPRPVGAVRGEMDIVKMQRNGLEISTISAALPDFDFDLKLNVTGFKMKVDGQATVEVNGNRLDSRAKSVLQRAKRGSTVQIFDIEAKIAGNSGYKLKKVSPVFVELTN